MQLPVIPATALPAASDWGLRLRNVGVKMGEASILKNVSVDFPCHRLSAVIGPNGAGKTTLLHAILNLIPHTGQVEFCPVHATHGGRDDVPRTGQARVAYIPQRLDFDRSLPIRVLDFLALPMQRRPLWLGVKPALREQSAEALAELQAEKLLFHHLGQLSGGELQRVMLAGALLRRPDVLLMDEPISGVDVLGEALFCELLERIHRRLECTTILVSHDLSVVNRHAGFVVCLNREVVCSGPPNEVLTSDHLVRLYGGPVRTYSHAHGHGSEESNE